MELHLLPKFPIRLLPVCCIHAILSLFGATAFGQPPRLDSVYHSDTRDQYTAIYQYMSDRDFTIHRRYHSPESHPNKYLSIYEDSLCLYTESQDPYIRTTATHTYDDHRRLIMRVFTLHDTNIQHTLYQYLGQTTKPTYQLEYWLTNGDTTYWREKYIRYDSLTREISFTGKALRNDTLFEEYEYHLSYPRENHVRRQGVGYHEAMGYSTVDYLTITHDSPEVLFGDTIRTETRLYTIDGDSIHVDSSWRIRFTWGQPGRYAASGQITFRDDGGAEGRNTEAISFEGGHELRHSVMTCDPLRHESCDPKNWRNIIKHHFDATDTVIYLVDEFDQPLQKTTTGNWYTGDQTVIYYYSKPAAGILLTMTALHKTETVRVIRSLEPGVVYFDYTGRQVTYPASTMLLLAIQDGVRSRVLFVR